MAREIPLTQGQVTLVDDDDYDWLMQWKWIAAYSPVNNRYYVHRRDGKNKTIIMHREILNAPKGFHVDHINLDTLDNRRENLRVATNSQNQYNKPLQKNNTSGYKGVTYFKQFGKWVARIRVNNKSIYLGVFDTPEAAADARKIAAIELHGEFARFE